MKKIRMMAVIAALVFVGSFGISQDLLDPLDGRDGAEDCYEPTYAAKTCDTQGFDDCVNYDCPDNGTGSSLDL